MSWSYRVFLLASYTMMALQLIVLRWVYDTNHTSLTMAWESTIKPEWVGIINSNGESFWLYPFSIKARLVHGYNSHLELCLL